MTRAAAVAAYVAGAATLRELGRQAGVSHQRVAQWVAEDAPDYRRPVRATPPAPVGMTTRQVLAATGVHASRLDRWRRRYRLGAPLNPGRGRVVRYGASDLAAIAVLVALDRDVTAVVAAHAVKAARGAPLDRWVVASPHVYGTAVSAADVLALVRSSPDAVVTVVDLSHSALDIAGITSKVTP